MAYIVTCVVLSHQRYSALLPGGTQFSNKLYMTRSARNRSQACSRTSLVSDHVSLPRGFFYGNLAIKVGLRL